MMGPVVTLFVFNEEVRNGIIKGEDGAFTYNAVLNFEERLTQRQIPSFQIVIAVVGAVLVGVGGFRHLFNRRMTDMVNSVPVKRQKQFAVISLNGFLIWLIPAVISMLLTAIISAAQLAPYGFGPRAAMSCFRSLLGAGVTFLLIYALVALSVSLAGTMFNAVLNMAFIGFDLIVGCGLIFVMCQDYFQTFSDFPLDSIHYLWLSSPISAVIWGAEVATLDGIVAGRFVSAPLLSFSVIMTVLIGAINLILALIIYVKRKSEEAEAGVANRPYSFITRTLNSIYAGLILSILIFDIMGIYHDGTLIGWQFFFTIIFTVLFFGLIEMIQSRSIKGFFDHKYQMAATVLASVVILAVFVFDLTNFDNRIIPQDSIQSARVNMNMNIVGDDGCGYEKVPGEEGFIRHVEGDPYMVRRANNSYWDISPETAYKVITALKEIYENSKTYIYDPVTGQKEEYTSDSPQTRFVSIEIKRPSGSRFVRNYRIVSPELVDEIINSEGFMEYLFPLHTGELGYPLGIRILGGGKEYFSAEVPKEYIQPLMDAYYRDFKNHFNPDLIYGVHDYDYHFELNYNVYFSKGDIRYWQYDGTSEYYSASYTIYIPDEFSEVYSVLKELYEIEPVFEEEE